VSTNLPTQNGNSKRGKQEIVQHKGKGKQSRVILNNKKKEG